LQPSGKRAKGKAQAGSHTQRVEALKEISPHQFEWWAVDLVNARPAKDHKKGADIRRLTDYINFFDDKSGQAKQVIVQVKSPSAAAGGADIVV